MKLKIVLLALCLTGLIPTSFSQMAHPNHVDPTYDTDVCSKIDPDTGVQTDGSQCYTPKTDGPCSRQTACKYE